MNRMETGMIREILKMGDPRLLQVAGPVEDIHDLALRAIIADMYETMHAAKGVGLAAPKIGEMEPSGLNKSKYQHLQCMKYFQ